ncbi:hypothetical protein HYPSUDRAFT_66037 [Hypholoma sublateritium FD-334 SS-4]|uniref:Uncharacterized protein n=1 Tax=Hypholoma sublateritium (strain FD-334 SS-4) TaxID=945553 RepID=A0A0D2NYZ8_HYPSF|nr:hypothetical protein HYPSUDRAFT_66037 [Hypholoma sublateritium FD-334 SS-4]
MANNSFANIASGSASSASPRKRPTARMHAARLRPTRQFRASGTSRSANGAVPKPSQAVKYAKGDCPPYNDWGSILEDVHNQKIYMFGGTRPDDNLCYPTADFYCCDVQTMKWINLTNSLIYRKPSDPFSEVERRPARKKLPRLSYPGCTLLRIHDSSFAFIFGGYDASLEKSHSGAIIVDLESRAWWNLPIEGRNISARIDPSVVAIGNKVYIFGGYRQFGDDPKPHNSLSIAEYLPDQGIWKWAVQDEPYSAPVPVGHVFGRACPVYNGTKILLTPGRLTDDNPIHFSQNNIFFYHTTHKRFQLATADFTGDFPRNISFYSLGRLQLGAATMPNPSPARTASSHLEIHVPVQSKRPRGRPRKYAPAAELPATAPPALISAPATASVVSVSSSVYVCAWVPVPNTEYIAPEVWQLHLSPDELVECMGVSQKISDLDCDFQGCMTVSGGRLRILGTAPVAVAPTPSAGTKRRRLGGEVDSGSEEDSEDDGAGLGGATWNIFFDIDLLHTLSQT